MARGAAGRGQAKGCAGGGSPSSSLRRLDDRVPCVLLCLPPSSCRPRVAVLAPAILHALLPMRLFAVLLLPSPRRSPSCSTSSSPSLRAALRAALPLLAVERPCTRCSTVLVDQERGESDDVNWLSKVLAKYRLSPPDPKYDSFDLQGTKFGVYCTPLNAGTVRAGDEVTVLERK